MNQVSPKTLLNSKWTKTAVSNREKHFAIIEVERDENNKVLSCIIQAVINNNEYDIDWRELKDSKKWRQGWQ